MEELKIDRKRVLEAASKCPQAKETLKTLFPEAFEEEDNIAMRKIPKDERIKVVECFATISEAFFGKGNGFIDLRNSGDKFNSRAIYLTNMYDWRMTQLSNGAYLLVAYKKQ